jgi:predicted regulator of Ras-like GTPase activity (Roadblock/LC7/MglB family)
MKTPAAADLQRWSEDVARDPRSLAFLPLARAYRRQGRHDTALRLCLKGLEAHPNHVEAHALLALLYAEQGERARAADEWAFVLRLDTSNFEALRGLGFCYLENGELSQARHHLERAALVRPGDPAVRDALRLIRERIDAAAERAGFDAGALSGGAAVASGEAAAAGGAPATAGRLAPDRATPIQPILPVQQPGTNGTGYHPVEPDRLFDAFLASGPLLGAILIDERGLVLAGRLGGDADADMLGAILNGAVAEAARTVTHLELGAWNGVLLETDVALVHISPVGSGAVVVLAARREAPAGWVVRTASQAAEIARRFLGGSS